MIGKKTILNEIKKNWIYIKTNMEELIEKVPLKKVDIKYLTRIYNCINELDLYLGIVVDPQRNKEDSSNRL
ncbi:MAG: hypothetical protein QXH92_04605 [Candidatus Aenigmatarchaeota archaeon]